MQATGLIVNYIITQVILAFWLVLAYDLLEDRRTIDVIISKFFPLCFKMAENFENLDNILCDWAKDEVQKSLVKALNKHKKQEEERKSGCLFSKWLRKNTQAILVGSRARPNQTHNWSCFASNLTNPINKMFMRLIYWKNSTFLSLKIIVDTLIDVRNETSKCQNITS